jgi:hypothetical protein
MDLYGEFAKNITSCYGLYDLINQLLFAAGWGQWIMMLLSFGELHCGEVGGWGGGWSALL